MGAANPPAPFIVRDATDADMAAVQAIYAHNVLHGRASFEETPPSLSEMLERRRTVTGMGIPYLVAEVGGEIAGYSYATSYRRGRLIASRSRTRCTSPMRSTAAASAPRCLGRSSSAADSGPWRQMLAIIGDSGNASSIAVHRRLGFEHVGTLNPSASSWRVDGHGADAARAWRWGRGAPAVTPFP
jgi:phosphinothricin acetyltransferase